MSDEDLEVLITLDDTWYGPDEDSFHHLQSDTDKPCASSASPASATASQTTASSCAQPLNSRPKTRP